MGGKRPVTRKIADRLLQQCQVEINSEHQILEVITKGFMVDGVEVKDPTGMVGSKLEAAVQVVSVNTQLVE